MAELFNNLLDRLAQEKADTSVPKAPPSIATADSNPAPVNPQVPTAKALPQATAPQAEPAQAQPSVAEPRAQAPGNAEAPAAPQSSFEALLQRKQAEKIQENPDSDGTLESPINMSPLSTSDRAKLSMGNAKGSIGYLKKRFEDAAFTEKDGLLVKSGGAWHKVDESGFGQYFRDPWELSRDIADLGDIGINVAGTTAGAAAGASAGPAGLIGGAAVGGAASGALRTSLGRIVGTYEADAKEQVKDIGLEALLSAGAEGIALGVKPAMPMVVNAAKKVGSWASETAKDVLTSVLGTSTGAGKAAMNTIIENPEAYSSAYKAIAAGATGAEDIVNRSVTKQIAHVDTLLTTAAQELPNQYGKLLDTLVESAGKKQISVDTTAVLSNAAQAIEDNGFGTVIKKGSSFKFVPFGPEAINSRTVQGLPIELLDGKATQEISKVVSKMASFSKIGTLEGKGAAKALQVMNKSLNQVSSDAFKGDISSSAARAISKVAEGFRNGVADQFEKNGLGEEYGALQSIYSTFANAVNGAKQVLKNDGQEALVKKLTSAAGKNMTAKGDVQLLIQLGGKQAEKAYQNLVITDAVKNTASWAPKLSMPLKAGATASAITGASMGAHLAPAAIAIAAPIATQFSPKLVGKELATSSKVASAVGAGTKAVLDPVVNYAFHSLDFLRTLSQPALKQFLQDPKAIVHVFSAPEEAADGEGHGVQQLLEQGGVIPKNGQ